MIECYVEVGAVFSLGFKVEDGYFVQELLYAIGGCNIVLTRSLYRLDYLGTAFPHGIHLRNKLRRVLKITKNDWIAALCVAGLIGLIVLEGWATPLAVEAAKGLLLEYLK